MGGPRPVLPRADSRRPGALVAACFLNSAPRTVPGIPFAHFSVHPFGGRVRDVISS